MVLKILKVGCSMLHFSPSICFDKVSVGYTLTGAWGYKRYLNWFTGLTIGLLLKVIKILVVGCSMFRFPPNIHQNKTTLSLGFNGCMRITQCSMLSECSSQWVMICSHGENQGWVLNSPFPPIFRGNTTLLYRTTNTHLKLSYLTESYFKLSNKVWWSNGRDNIGWVLNSQFPPELSTEHNSILESNQWLFEDYVYF